jgi:PAS domain S-box-containing protein
MHEREYFDTICNTGDGVFIVDANKHIIRWNKGAEKILGYSEPEVLNHDCFQVILGTSVVDKTVCSPNCRIHSSALKGTPHKNFDLPVRASSGEPLWINMSLISPSESGEPFVAHIIRDVTRLKRRALALEQFLASLESSQMDPQEISAENPTGRLSASRHPAQEKLATALSSREIEVLMLLAEGLSTKNLAEKLGISHFTARNHIQNILVKLDLHSKAQAVSYAFKRGIL